MSKIQKKRVCPWNYKGHLNRLIILIIALFLIMPSVLSATAEFTNQQELKFNRDASDGPGTLYQDAIGANVDVGIEVCDIVAPYVGAFYALHTSSGWESILVSYMDSNNALSATTQDGSCYSTPPALTTVSPSELPTPDPDVYRAALPSNLWIGYSNVPNPGSTISFIYANESAKLGGSYDLTRRYQSDGSVLVTPTSITFAKSSGTFSYSASESDFGISSTRPAVVGICNDTYGYVCDDGDTITSAAPNSLDSKLNVNSNDIIYDRHVVINGMSYPMCIGANLDPTINSETPNSIYYSQTLEINYTVENPRDTPTEERGGNVDVTSTFYVQTRIYNSTGQQVFIDTETITENIVPDGTTTTKTVSWPAYGHSGTYRIEVEANPDLDPNMKECYESDNTAIASFELKPITLPDIYIDGVDTNNFTYPNIPYNLTFVLENSDGDVLSNASLIIKERNGLSLTAPTQRFNISKVGGGTIKSGPVVDTYVNLISDASGRISLTFIPTYNSLYLSRYNYTDIESYIGNYSLEFTGTESNGQSFMFILEGEDVVGDYPFNVNNLNYTGSYSGKDIPYEAITSQVMDFIYHTFTNFIDVVLS